MTATSTEAYKTTFKNIADIENYVGKEIGLSEWFEISQERIDVFADVTEDHQWIHIDPEKSAKHSPYKTTIAHGFLVLSMASKIAYATFEVNNMAMGVNYGLNKVRFTNAVPAGALVRGRVSLKDYKEIKGGARYVMDIVFEIKGQERPACVAEWIGQGYAGPAQKIEETPKQEVPKEEREPTVLYRRDGKVGIVTLNRPNNYNAITAELLSDFSVALDKAKMDRQAKTIVVHGSGKGFCAGADLAGGMDGMTPPQVRDHLNKNYGDVIRRLTEMDKPVIAAIHGSAAGAGLGFALGCDFRVMADNSNMRYAFINIGLGPDAGSSWFLTRTVGYSKALQIVTEGEKIPAEECLRLNLTNKVVPVAELMDKALEWANKLADRPPLGFMISKKDIKFGMTHGLLDTIAYEAENQVIGLSSIDHQEGGMAFFEKRNPKFIGK